MEVARIPDSIREAPLGEIRLQWWQDQVAAALSGEPGGSPVVRALADAARRHRLPPAPLEALIAARSFDLYSDPPPTAGDLEGLLGEQESAQFQMAAIVCGADAAASAEAAGHAGIAYGIARRLARFAADRARARSPIPTDMLRRHDLAAPTSSWSLLRSSRPSSPTSPRSRAAISQKPAPRLGRPAGRRIRRSARWP